MAKIEYALEFDLAQAKRDALQWRSLIQREMSDIDLLPRSVRVDAAADAKNIGRGIRFALENELRNVDLIDDRSVQQAIREANRIEREFEEAGRAARQASSVRSGAGGGPTAGRGNFDLLGTTALSGGLGAVAGVTAGGFAVREIIQRSAAISDEAAAARAAAFSFETLSGSSADAAKNLEAVKSAMSGAVDTTRAQQLATDVLVAKLADTSDGIRDVVLTARTIATVSSQINSVDDALGQLILFKNSSGFARADQLALDAESLKQRIRELREENDALSDSDARLIAAQEQIRERFGGVTAEIEQQVRGVAILRARWADLQSDFANFAGPKIDGIAEDIAALLGADLGPLREAQRQIDAIQLSIDELSAVQGEDPIGALFGVSDLDETRAAEKRLTEFRDAIKASQEALQSGAPGAQAYASALTPLVQEVLRFGEASDARVDRLRSLDVITSSAANGVDFLAQAEKAAAEAAKEMEAATRIANEALLESERASLAAGAGLDGFGGSAGAALFDVYNLTDGVITLSQHLAQVGAQLPNLQRVQTAVNSRITSAAAGVVGVGGTGPQQAKALADAAQEAFDDAFGFAQNFAQSSGTDLTERDAAILQADLLNDALAGFDDVHQRERDRIAAERKATQEATRATKSAAADLSAAAREIDNQIKKVSGLFDNSEVTQEDLDAAAAGTYREKADEFRRRANDELKPGGRDYEDVDAADIARRLNVDVTTPNEVLLQLLNERWDDSSLFAGGQNLDLINLDAVRAEVDRQRAAADGEAELLQYVRSQLGVALEPYTGGSAGGGASTPSVGGASAAATPSAPSIPDIGPQSVEIIPVLPPEPLFPPQTVDITANIIGDIEAFLASTPIKRTVELELTQEEIQRYIDATALPDAPQGVSLVAPNTETFNDEYVLAPKLQLIKLAAPTDADLQTFADDFTLLTKEQLVALGIDQEQIDTFPDSFVLAPKEQLVALGISETAIEDLQNSYSLPDTDQGVNLVLTPEQAAAFDPALDPLVQTVIPNVTVEDFTKYKTAAELLLSDAIGQPVNLTLSDDGTYTATVDTLVADRTQTVTMSPDTTALDAVTLDPRNQDIGLTIDRSPLDALTANPLSVPVQFSIAEAVGDQAAAEIDRIIGYINEEKAGALDIRPAVQLPTPTAEDGAVSELYSTGFAGAADYVTGLNAGLAGQGEAIFSAMSGAANTIENSLILALGERDFAQPLISNFRADITTEASVASLMAIGELAASPIMIGLERGLGRTSLIGIIENVVNAQLDSLSEALEEGA